MKNRKMMLMIVAVFVIIVAVAAGVCFWRTGSQIESQELVFDGNADEEGIHYGGSFDEFEYLTEDEAEVDETKPDNQTNKIQGDNAAFETTDEAVPANENPMASMTDSNDIEAELIRQGKIIKEDDEELNQFKFDNSVGDDKQNQEENQSEADANENDIPIFDSNGYEEHQVICDAESLEEAEAIASKISGVVLSCDHGVATIQIEESVDSLLQRLEEQGSELELYRNYKYSIK